MCASEARCPQSFWDMRGRSEPKPMALARRKYRSGHEQWGLRRGRTRNDDTHGNMWRLRPNHAMRTTNGEYLTVRRLVSKSPSQYQAWPVPALQSKGNAMRVIWLFVLFPMSPPGKGRVSNWRALRKVCLARAQKGK